MTPFDRSVVKTLKNPRNFYFNLHMKHQINMNYYFSLSGEPNLLNITKLKHVTWWEFFTNKSVVVVFSVVIIVAAVVIPTQYTKHPNPPETDPTQNEGQLAGEYVICMLGFRGVPRLRQQSLFIHPLKGYGPWKDFF